MSDTLLMPAFSPTMEVGAIARWCVAEGQSFRAGDVLAEIETDKAVLELEAVQDGVLGRILVPQGAEEIAVGVAIATLERAQAAAPPAATSPRPLPPRAIHRASPLARRLAREWAIPLAGLSGSGPGGRVLRRDVEAARAATVAAAGAAPASQPVADAPEPAPALAPAPALPSGPELRPTTAPTGTVGAEVDLSAVIRLAERFAGGHADTFLDAVHVRALALALPLVGGPARPSLALAAQTADGPTWRRVDAAGLSLSETAARLVAAEATEPWACDAALVRFRDPTVASAVPPLLTRVTLAVTAPRGGGAHIGAIWVSYDAASIHPLAAGTLLARVKATLEDPVLMIA